MHLLGSDSKTGEAPKSSSGHKIKERNWRTIETKIKGNKMYNSFDIPFCESRIEKISWLM